MLTLKRRGGLDRFFSARRAEARRRAMRPLLEGFEDRVVLSTILWNSTDAPAGGAWNVASNWGGGVVPGADDDAIIDLASPGKVTVSATASVKSLTTDADTNFTLSNGVFTVTADSTLSGSYTQTGGELTGDGTFTVAGLTTWTSGTMSGTGVTKAEGGMVIGQTINNVWAQLSGRTLENVGAATLVARDPYFGMHISNGATINNLPGASFTFLTDAQVYKGDTAGGTFNNQGTVAKTGGTGVGNINIVLNNSGVVEVESGILELTGVFSNYSSTTKTLTGGSYIVSSTLRFSGADIVANAANITLIGADSKILDASNNNALRNLASNAAVGSLTLRGGRSLATPGALANAGSVTVESGSTLTTTGAYNQSGGSTNLIGGVLTSTANAVNINGGLLGGSGTVNGNVVNAGYVVPGGVDGTGILEVVGGYEQTAAGALTANLGGVNPGTGYGRLSVSGEARLGGTLYAPLVGGFAPGDGAEFEVVTYGSRVGAFAEVVPQNLPPGTSMSHGYRTDAFVLNAEVAPVLASIAVSPAKGSVAKGWTTEFLAVGTYTDGSTADLTNLVTWASADVSVATISSESPTFGVAKGLREGSTTITATLEGLVGSASLTVSPAVVVSIAVTPADSSLAKGLTAQFKATGTYSDDSTADLTSKVVWASANPSLATVSETGEATAKNTGQVRISARFESDDVTGSTMLNVTPEELISIAVSPAETSVAKGLTKQFQAVGTYTDNSTRNLTGSVAWESADVSIATIAGNGVATAKAEGSTTITAKSGDFSASATLIVDPAILVSLAIEPTNSSVAKGLTKQFKATGTYSDQSTRDITGEVSWTSSALAVATINASGEATAQGVGQTTIKAASPFLSAQTTLTVTKAELASIVLSPADASLAKGLTTRFTAMGVYTDQSTDDVSRLVEWSSSVSAVASINGEGLATARSEGQATINAKIGELVGSTVLIVTPAELVSFAVSPATANVAKGLDRQFNATGSYTDGSTRNLSALWKSSDEGVAAISASGLASTLAEGQTTITATYGDWSASSVLTVTPAALTAIAIDPMNPTLAQGSSAQFQATGTYTDDSTKDITEEVLWSSLDSAIAAITAGGLATAKSEGSTKIAAVLDGVRAETTLTVTAAALTSITVDPADSSLAKGRTRVFLATGHYTDGSTQDLSSQVAWASSNPGAATISNQPGFRGLATAVAEGNATITATLGDWSGSAILIVTPAELVSIVIGPVNPTVVEGQTQAFTATGTYTDQSTLNLTNDVDWTSLDEAIATIAADGVATAVLAGSTTIKATLGAVTASTTMTVEAKQTPAIVTATTVSWGSSGMASLETAGDGLRLLPAGRSHTIGWYGIDRISITLDKAADLAGAEIAVSGLIGVDYGPVSVIGSGTSWLITLAKPINAADRVTIDIGGEGVAAFTRQLDVLPGDVDDDGLVTLRDVIYLRNAIQGVEPTLDPFYFLDVLGETDGKPTKSAYDLARRLIGSRLP